jgi:transcriptional regulator with XRE-family HTH domain
MLDLEVHLFLRVVRMRLSNARRKIGLTQEEAADRAQLPVRTYQGLEGIRDGRSFNPTLLTLTVSNAVGIELGKLIEPPTIEDLRELEKTSKLTSSRRTKSIKRQTQP